MTTPDWLKPGIYGAVLGAVVVSAIGFSWGGWTTAGTANQMASTRAHDAVVAALVPVCVNMSSTDPDRTAKLATIKAASSYDRQNALIKAGWATVPGSGAPNRDLAQACVNALKLGDS